MRRGYENFKSLEITSTVFLRPKLSKLFLFFNLLNFKYQRYNKKKFLIHLKIINKKF